MGDMKPKFPFVSVEKALADIKAGKMVIVIDDPDRENEGDLVMAADKVTPEAINFMITHARGLLCVPIEGKRLDELGIGPMVASQGTGKDTAFTVSIDGIKQVDTGISAKDRYYTVKQLIDPKFKAEDFRRPGHMFPLRYKEGGVLMRAGHTEASVDLSRMAGLYPAGVICEIINPDGTMARLPQLKRFAMKHKLGILTIESMIAYRRAKESLVERQATADLPLPFGDFKIHLYRDKISGAQHIALTLGEVKNAKDVLVRVHSSCITGDTLHSLRCDCGAQRDKALNLISKEGKGVFVYLNQEGRGLGLLNKLKSYELQDQGFDTVEANEVLGIKTDARDYGIGEQILKDLGLTTIRILTNNPKKIVGIHGHGLNVTARLPLQATPKDLADPRSKMLRSYLKTKKKKMGHLIDLKKYQEDAKFTFSQN